jgi:hypothetical protein
MAILQRVVEGEIIQPEQRNPARARSIPRELSAIAMKALAKKPQDRYQHVEALRKDIERYQEGRSVSAKQDTFREMAWKLVKRNKGFSAASVAGFLVALIILSFSFKYNYVARVRAETAKQETARVFANYQQEQTDKEKRTREAVPAFVQSARLMANDGRLDKALKQVDVALAYEPDNVDARLLKGQIFIGQRDWKAGRAELEAYLKRRRDADASRLLELCVPGKEKDSAVLFQMAEVFQHESRCWQFTAIRLIRPGRGWVRS